MNLSKKQFWTGVIILLNNYHAINRKLFACYVTRAEKIIKDIHQLKLNFNEPSEHFNEEIDKSLLIPQLWQITGNENVEKSVEGFIVHFKCIPKKYGDSVRALGLIDLLNSSFRMIFNSDAILDFEVKLKDELVIDILNENPEFDKSPYLKWRDFMLRPKFYKWCLNENYNSEHDKGNDNGSLRLIDIEKYNRLYNILKLKYSERVMKMWNDAKESTDPLKFIYEDFAIAAYLITLWESKLVNEPPAAFADLGCGNGLLVYILIQEGYRGYGYDVRQRKLWSLYPVEVTSHLYEQTIEPFKFNLPTEVNWLIGNHSDELSPWLPVLAATCHKRINFFLLPCCAFEFSGNKFQRRNSSLSGYRNFCDYAEQISNVCGFETRRDRLKIPSTKRIAIIGFTRLQCDKDFIITADLIKRFVKNEQREHPSSSLEDIKLREKVEAVRNCTKIENSIIETLVKEIFFLLLKQDLLCDDTKAGDTNYWQTGGRLTISEIAKSLDRNILKKIKSECGGLKTLLRNKHEIFQFQQPDFVLIRKPQRRNNDIRKCQTTKKRACFFKLNHPQGCPLKDYECTFVH